MTKTEHIVGWLKDRPMTYGAMLRMSLSTSPWKRVAEWLERNPKWKLRKGTVTRGGQVLTTWRIVRAR